jgi:hypothetical protein
MFAALTALGACLATHRAYIVDQPPPQPQFEQVEVRPGQVWMSGYWYWADAQWQWQPGHYESDRAGQVWRDGYWEPRDGRWHWVDGRWEVNTGAVPVEVHDHRTPPPDQPPGTIIVPSQMNPH